MGAVELRGVKNVRDLGLVPVSGSRVVMPGLIYRGAHLQKATGEDLAVLSNRCRIRHVVDVRVGWEREAKPNRAVPGADCLFVPFFDKELVGVEYEKPIPNTRMRGHDFVCDPDDFYRSMANPLTVGQMRKAVNQILVWASKGEAVYFHCSGGKDRAGIVALLLLSVLGASREAILEDYLLTNVSRDANIEGVYQRFLYLCYGDEGMAREVTDSHRARPENLDAFCGEVDRLYGGMDAFVRNQLGIDDEMRTAFRRACTQEA